MFGITMRQGLLILAAVVLIAGAVFVSAALGQQGSGMARAFSILPKDTLSVGYTHWGQITEAVGNTPTTDEEREEFDSQARERDLSTRSVLAGRSQELHEAFGWTLSDLDWDAYGQARAGNVVVIGLSKELPVSEVVDSFRNAGYKQKKGIWQAQSDEFRRAHPDLPTELNNVLVVDRHTLLAGSRSEYVDEVRNTKKTLASKRSMRQASTQVSDAITALVEDGPLGCQKSGFDELDATTLAAARTAVENSRGQLRRYQAAARAIDVEQNGQSMRFVQTFDSAATASNQLRVREDLTVGPFIGRGGDVADALSLDNARADAQSVVLTFDQDVSAATFMDGVGPVLFATCPLPGK